MDKIKNPLQSLPLRRSLALYVIVFSALALVLSASAAFACSHAANKIRAAYPPSGEKYYLTNAQGEQLGEGVYIGAEPVPLSARDERAVALLEALPPLAAFVLSVSCLMAAASLFYRNKLKTPLAELRAASEKISDNDLNFSIAYTGGNELGQLCSSFERMRAILAGNFSEMWRQVEERRALNAAFAHELRTPLTVLKGYTEMLLASGQMQTKEIAATMEKQITRMEAYISGMSTLCRLEDAQPNYASVSLPLLLSSLYESAKIICGRSEKALHFQDETSAAELLLDSSFVSQVCGNLLSNAVRYARSAVTLSFSLHDGGLLLSVSDDGKGFDAGSLSKAAEPYFTQERNSSSHFGLGLYICKLLCVRHGGFLRFENLPSGAKASAFFQSPPAGR